MTISLSILDLSPIDAGQNSAQALCNTVDLARHAERLGYTRFWLGEHHNTSMMASSAPEIMIAHIAQATQNIRVGSGGVMLPHYAALKVAEVFHVLEALHPGRIDLGIGRAPGTDLKTAEALRHSAESFSEQLQHLFGFLSTGFAEKNHPLHDIKASPCDVAMPPIWLLGSSEYSARIAALSGQGFAFAHHINPLGAQQATRLYQETFQPSPARQQPHTIVATSVICAETEEEMRRISAPMVLAFVRLYSDYAATIPALDEALAHDYTLLEHGRANAVRAQGIIGTSEHIKVQLEQLASLTRADELMITAFVSGHENRLRIYETLAEQFCLQPCPIA